MTADQVIATCRQTDAPLAADLPKAAVVTESSAPLLSIKGLSVRFGGIVALDMVDCPARHKKVDERQSGVRESCALCKSYLGRNEHCRSDGSVRKEGAIYGNPVRREARTRTAHPAT